MDAPVALSSMGETQNVRSFADLLLGWRRMEMVLLIAAGTRELRVVQLREWVWSEGFM